MEFKDQVRRAFGETVRALRRERKLSQEALALDSGVDRSFLSQLENGHREPTISTALRLAYGLEVTASQLLARMEDGRDLSPGPIE